jgi:hypothetical protein
LPKTTLPLTKNTVVAAGRVIPFEHPFPERQKQSASALLNKAQRIANMRVFARAKTQGRKRSEQ